MNCISVFIADIFQFYLLATEHLIQEVLPNEAYMHWIKQLFRIVVFRMRISEKKLYGGIDGPKINRWGANYAFAGC